MYIIFFNFRYLYLFIFFSKTLIYLQACPEFKVIKIVYDPHGSILSPEC